MTMLLRIITLVYATILRLVRNPVDFVIAFFKQPRDLRIIPKSVNYHFTRACNYRCGFCFHTATTSFVLPLADAQQGLLLLRDAGMEKINFSGGEPFIYKKGQFVGDLVVYCKDTLQLKSVTIVSNGSLITADWMAKYGKYLDILAISCDSFDAQVNNTIGRWQNSKTNHIEKMETIREWCREFNVLFKINTVVNTYNVHEDMSARILDLQPVRWKVFQCLLIYNENVGPTALKNAETFVISDDDFDAFVARHAHVDCLVPESNVLMKNSYLILDEYMRFLNCQGDSKDPSNSILDVGVQNALKFAGFDEVAFLERGGVYKWSKAKQDTLDW
uniref:S-adenosylmethionine-dependent nucleotide dehydratase RSAD2 n=1 Tax=Cacopsylla melanoneura TaxID=428564 RepID=A0A8D8S7P0_9HEMI